VPPIGPSSELTHAGRLYELTLLVSTVLVTTCPNPSIGGKQWPDVNYTLDLGITATNDLLSCVTGIENIVANFYIHTNSVHCCFVSKGKQSLLRAYLVDMSDHC